MTMRYGLSRSSALIVAVACSHAGYAPATGEGMTAVLAECPILTEAAIRDGTSGQDILFSSVGFPPFLNETAVVPYPAGLGIGDRALDSARIDIVVDRDGSAPECAVQVLALSDSSLLPHVAPAVAAARFNPGRAGERWAPARIRTVLYFGTAERVRAAAGMSRPPVELVLERPPILEPGAPMPVYPIELIPQRVEGRVVVQADVNPTGLVDLATIRVVSSDHPAFTSAVRAILPALRFQPALTRPGGEPITSRVQLPFEFRFPGKGAGVPPMGR